MLVALVACGRIGFDPVGGTAGDANDTDAAIGGAGEACASAGVLVIGQPLSGQSLAGAANDVSTAPCPDGVDVVYAVTSSTTAMRNFVIDANFSGALVVARMCPPIGFSCTGFIANTQQSSGMNIMTGTTYVIIEKTSGAGTTFSLSLQ